MGNEQGRSKINNSKLQNVEFATKESSKASKKKKSKKSKPVLKCKYDLMFFGSEDGYQSNLVPDINIIKVKAKQEQIKIQKAEDKKND